MLLLVPGRVTLSHAPTQKPSEMVAPSTNAPDPRSQRRQQTPLIQGPTILRWGSRRAKIRGTQHPPTRVQCCRRHQSGPQSPEGSHVGTAHRCRLAGGGSLARVATAEPLCSENRVSSRAFLLSVTSKLDHRSRDSTQTGRPRTDKMSAPRKMPEVPPRGPRTYRNPV